MSYTPEQWKKVYRSREFRNSYYYGGPLGAECGAQGTEFTLWSPYADAVNLCLYKDGTGVERTKRMKMDPGVCGCWNYETPENLHGTYYSYEIITKGHAVITADPYARAAGLNGKRSMVVDLKRTDPEGWSGDSAPANDGEHIIYEMHVKEYSWDPAGGFPEEFRGKYKAITCEHTCVDGDPKHPSGIDYLKALGVTDIQLMPVYDFGSVDEADPSQFNWGYDPVNYNVPEGAYSCDPSKGEVRIRELKEAIQTLHRNGFRVIMDVVYNHTYDLNTPFQKTAPWYFYRVGKNGETSNGSACGNDVASEQPMCRRYIIDSVLYWAQEYHIDGFRFDLMGLLDVDLMNAIRQELDRRFGPGVKTLHGEPWSAGPSDVEGNARLAVRDNIRLLKPDIAMFWDTIRDCVKGPIFFPEKGGFVNGGEGYDEKLTEVIRQETEMSVTPDRVITYVSSHDNHTLEDRLAITTPDSELRRRQYHLAQTIYMTFHGTPFMLSGEEFARTKQGIENSFRSPIGINRIDWRRTITEEKTVRFTQGLIALRKMLPAYRDKSAKAGERISGITCDHGVVSFLADNADHRDAAEREASGRAGTANMGASDMARSDSGWSRIFTIFNRTEETREVALPDGKWQILLDGEDSFAWKKNREAGASAAVSGKVSVQPVAAMILGEIK
ncbi:MAG: type I pullulanase [Eubacterium sp.]|nr:type I pullulanase [Eubacterium sp.]